MPTNPPPFPLTPRISNRLRSWTVAGLLVAFAASLPGCTVYSFSGASIPSNLETISVPIAQDNTSSPVNRLGADLTDLLTDRFVDRTRLSLTTDDAGADALLTARIQRYTNEPTGVSGDERATTNQGRYSSSKSPGISTRRTPSASPTIIWPVPRICAPPNAPSFRSA